VTAQVPSEHPDITRARDSITRLREQHFWDEHGTLLDWAVGLETALAAAILSREEAEAKLQRTLGLIDDESDFAAPAIRVVITGSVHRGEHA
jgi:hypothetical protein